MAGRIALMFTTAVIDQLLAGMLMNGPDVIGGAEAMVSPGCHMRFTK